MTEVTLITEIVTKDSGGLPEKKSSEIVVYASEKSIVRTEFYQAMRSGITPKKTFELRQEDFALSGVKTKKGMIYASKLLCDGVKYNVIRTYQKGKSKIELVCM